MEKYILTDFNKDRWKGIKIDTIKSAVEKLNEKINKIGCIYGQIGNPTNMLDVTLSNSSHFIKNIKLDNGKIYGDVIFLDNTNGKNAYNLINNLNYQFGIRSIGISEQYKGGEIEIETILTWDIIEN